MPFRRRYVVAAFSALVLASAGTYAYAAQPTSNPTSFKHLSRPARPHDSTAAFDQRSLLVKFKSGASAAAKDKALAGHGARSLGAIRGTRYVKVQTDGSAPDVLKVLKKDPAVQSAQLNYERHATAVPNDEFYASGDQAYLSTVRLPQAWDLSKGSTSQVIAVVDTGVNVNQQDLVGRTVAGYNVLSPGAAPNDDANHGTMVAGIAAANTNNSVGIAGAAWTAKVMPVKVLNSQGEGLDSDVATGITWAADHGAKIINLSLGGPGESPALHDAISYATGKGIVVVVAAGNSGDGTVQYPAAYPEVLSVGATDKAGNTTDFSSYGDWLDVSAPGFGIVSTGYDPDNVSYYIGDGTSFSAPIVSGIAALVRTKYPTYTPAQVISRIESTSRDAGPRGIDPYYGYGIVDAYAALGGRWAADFPQPARGAGESNDVPGRATTLSSPASGTIDREGDVDWYSYTSAADAAVDFSVTPAAFNGNVQNNDPVVSVYDHDLKLLKTVDDANPGYPEKLSVHLGTGSYYVSVRNFNGAIDLRPYTLSVAPAAVDPGPATPGQQEFVRNVSPAPFVTGQAVLTKPTVTFAPAVDPASVTSSTVRLVNGRTGADVPAAVSFDATADAATITPSAALQDNTPYRIVVSGLTDTGAVAQAGTFSSTFSTVDLTPPPVINFRTTGGLGKATLNWTKPAITDLDQVIVRMSVGSLTPPSSPTTGTAAYAGTASTATITTTAGKNYAFAVWVRDRSGKTSSAATGKLRATTMTVSSSTTALTYRSTVTVTGRLTRTDTGAALAAVPVDLYGRTKGSSTWTKLATVTSSSTGNVSFVHKPGASLDYQWRYAGSTSYFAVNSALRSVGVRPYISATFSSASISLGSTVTFSGSVSPSHAGRTVYLQRSVNGVWSTVTSKALSSASQYSFSIKPTGRGTYAYRIYLPAHTDHLAGYSSVKYLKVS